VNFFRNLILNLPATGPAATICTFAMCIAAVGIRGIGALAAMALASLQFLTALFIFCKAENMGPGLALCITTHQKAISHRTGTTINASAGLTAGGAITNFVCDGLNPVEEKNGVTFRDGEVTSSSVRQTSRLIANCA
jgi:hypothetical protein